MKKHLLLFLFCSISTAIHAQLPNVDTYHKHVKVADSLYRAKAYLQSGNTYALAFKAFGGKGYMNDRYNAACSWALANVPDSAFLNLERIATRAAYADYDHLTTDSDLRSLYNDPRWLPLTKLVKVNEEKSFEKYNKPLLYTINDMVKEDQKWRNLITKFNNKEINTDSITVDYLHKQMRMTDSLHHQKLWDIFMTYGFPNYDMVGEKASGSFWLLIQHQDAHPKFQEAVLEKMKIEVDKGKANSRNYAYLVDRVKVNTGQPQVYGTQMILNAEGTSFQPREVIEPEKLNERRASMGLETIEEYTQFMNSHFHGALKK